MKLDHINYEIGMENTLQRRSYIQILNQSKVQLIFFSKCTKNNLSLSPNKIKTTKSFALYIQIPTFKKGYNLLNLHS